MPAIARRALYQGQRLLQCGLIDSTKRGLQAIGIGKRKIGKRLGTTIIVTVAGIDRTHFNPWRYFATVTISDADVFQGLDKRTEMISSSLHKITATLRCSKSQRQ
jgi:hypothetical protein